MHQTRVNAGERAAAGIMIGQGRQLEMRVGGGRIRDEKNFLRRRNGGDHTLNERFAVNHEQRFVFAEAPAFAAGQEIKMHFNEKSFAVWDRQR